MDGFFLVSAHPVPGQREIQNSLGSRLQAAQATSGCGELISASKLKFAFVD